MVHRARRRFPRSFRFPHVHGDGPSIVAAPSSFRKFSPRAWGWSAAVGARVEDTGVFPTCVGMVRYAPSGMISGGSFPHVRGDGPEQIALWEEYYKFSPRAWGWSCASEEFPPAVIVFPTCVGMVRNRTSWTWPSPSFPHVRGDGPGYGFFDIRVEVFSPRAWGCGDLNPGSQSIPDATFLIYL